MHDNHLITNRTLNFT